MICWPYRLILRGIHITRQRAAAQQLSTLRLRALADGMDQGRTYVPDPSDPPSKSTAHYDLKRFRQTEEALERAAQPWEFTQAAMIRRREREEDLEFARLAAAMRGMSA